MLLHICGSRPRCLTNETSFETFIGWIVVVVMPVCLYLRPDPQPGPAHAQKTQITGIYSKS